MGQEEVVVCFGGMFGDTYHVTATNDTSGHILVRSISEQSAKSANKDDMKEPQKLLVRPINYSPTTPILDIEVNGNNKVLQIFGEDSTGLFTVKFCGAEMYVHVMSTKEYDFSRHMKEPKVVDTSNLIMSPMPGTLMSYAVNEGD